MGPVGNWLPIYWMSCIAHFSIKIQKLLLVYSLINNAIRKRSYLFILRLNNLFRFHVLITLFFVFFFFFVFFLFVFLLLFCFLLQASKSLARPSSSDIESVSREAWPRLSSKMAAPIRVVRFAHALGKPPDKRVEREVIFRELWHFLRHGVWKRSADGQVAMKFV